MPLSLHLFIHFSLAVMSGYLPGRYFGLPLLGLLAGLLGGFLIDLDHVLEYFFVFGLNFNFDRFFSGWQFLKSDTIYLIFHAWEWVALFLVLAFLFRFRKNIKIFLLVFALAITVHLISDSLINNYPPRFYTISYRASQDFSAERLLSHEQWQGNLELKKELGFD